MQNQQCLHPDKLFLRHLHLPSSDRCVRTWDVWSISTPSEQGIQMSRVSCCTSFEDMCLEADSILSSLFDAIWSDNGRIRECRSGLAVKASIICCPSRGAAQHRARSDRVVTRTTLNMRISMYIKNLPVVETTSLAKFPTTALHASKALHTEWPSMHPLNVEIPCPTQIIYS